MKFVIDNNVLFSLMNPFSTASYLFSSIRVEFIAPEFIRSEMDEHFSECHAKSDLSEHEFELRLLEIEELITFIEESEYEEFLAKAKSEIVDPDDSDFLALALSANASIWSNDPHFKKQSLVPVFTTSELVKLLLADKI